MKKWILLLLFSSSAAMADISIKADISPDIVRPGDPLEYEVTIVASGKDSADDVAIPKFPGFQELGQSPSTSHVVSFVNGHMQSQTTKRIVVSLQAEKEGTIIIPATTVTSEGKTYRSEPITVKVDRKAMPQAQPRGGGPTTDPFDDPFSQDEDMAQLFNRLRGGGAPFARRAPRQAPAKTAPDATFEAPAGLFFVRAFPSKTKVYKGEEFLLSYYLYVDAEAQIAGLEYNQLPKLNGFWKDTLFQLTNTGQLQWEVQRVGSRTFRRALLLQYTLSPLTVGKKTVDALKIVTQLVEQRQRGGFGFNLPTSRPYTRASENVDINVVPLPADGQPKDFAGAVGQFTLTPGELPRDIKMNNAFSYRVTLRGEGNFNAIDRLNFVPPSGVESFDLKIEKDKNAKTFEYILIPRKGGSILLPPVALSYFDPRKDAYTTITVPAQTIQVSGQASSETPRPPPPPDTPQATASPVAPSAPLLKETLPSPTVRWLRESAGIWAAALAWTAVALGLIIRTARAAKARGPLVRRTKKATVQSLAKQWKRKHSQLPSPSDLEDMRYALLHAVRDERGLETPIDRRRAVEDVLIDLKSTAPGDPVWSELSSSLQQLQRLGFSSASPEEKTASWRAVLDRLSLIKPR